jgi:hypothetical protein
MKLFWFLTGINKMDEQEITHYCSQIFLQALQSGADRTAGQSYYKINRYNKDDILALSGDRCKD